jgi:hypothetical protein
MHAIMAMARRAVESNNIAAMRAALTGTSALLFQIQTQRQRKAAKPPAILYCASCGKPVQVRRRPNLGQPVYCRRPSTCRWRAWAKRQRAATSLDQTPTAAQAAQSPPRSAPEPASGLPFWLAIRGR